MKKVMMILALVALGTTASADILIEPYLGYESGAQTAKFKSGATIGGIPVGGVSYGANTTNTVVGARLGYTFSALFWTAFDYSMGSGGKYKMDTAGTTEPEFTRDSLGLTFGFDFPILVRAWVGYNFTENLKNKYVGGDDSYKGTGTKVGVGFTGLPFVSINLEYIMRKYTEATGSAIFSTGVKLSDLYESYDHNTLMLSVSLPLEF